MTWRAVYILISVNYCTLSIAPSTEHSYVQLFLLNNSNIMYNLRFMYNILCTILCKICRLNYTEKPEFDQTAFRQLQLVINFLEQFGKTF